MSSNSESDASIEHVSENDNHQASNDSSSSESEEEKVLPHLRSLKNKALQKNKNSCMKLMLPEHLAAYMEERELDRDVEPLQCSADIIENIFGNYLIVKNILSHLRWQEKLISKEVCPLWNSAVNRLQLEQIGPVDFSINAGFEAVRDSVVMLKSSEFYTEPMAIFTFCSALAHYVCSIACQSAIPSPCKPPCDEDHSILDIIHQETTAPRDCMYTVKASSTSYMPLYHSPTMENIVKKPMQGSDASFYGICIPKIPGVEFKMINIHCSNGIQQDLMPEIKKLTENHTVKGVVACLTENYLLYVDENNAECLAFLNAMQPDVPFAFGGCLVEDTTTEAQDLVGIIDSVNKAKEFVSGNIMSLGLFVTQKDDSSTSVESRHNFEAYSFVLESSEWSKLKIAQAIQQFSESVPHFEHSVALKFSCLGRQHKHEAEQQSFRRYFPHTRVVGCFGNGELGVNHPRREPPPTNSKAKQSAKRPRYLAYEKVHSYSTVFFYIGWGRIIEEAERDD